MHRVKTKKDSRRKVCRNIYRLEPIFSCLTWLCNVKALYSLNKIVHGC